MKRALFLLFLIAALVSAVQPRATLAATTPQGFHTEFLPPLQRAAEAGRIGEVRRLLANGTKADEGFPEFGVTALMLASMRGHVDVVKLLLEAGADPNAFGVITHGVAFTPLLMAIGGKNKNKLAVIDTLIAGGAYLNPPPSINESPLETAVGNNDIEMVQALLKRGSDVNWEDSFGRTALVTAVFMGKRNVTMVTFLLKAGADPNKPRIWDEDDCRSILRQLDEELSLSREMRVPQARVAKAIRRLIVRAGGKSHERKSNGEPCKQPW